VVGMEVVNVMALQVQCPWSILWYLCGILCESQCGKSVDLFLLFVLIFLFFFDLFFGALNFFRWSSDESETQAERTKK